MPEWLILLLGAGGGGGVIVGIAKLVQALTERRQTTAAVQVGPVKEVTIIYRDLIDDLREEIAALRSRVQELETVRERVAELEGKLAAMEQDNERLRGERDALRERVRTLEEQVAQLNGP